MSTADLVSPRSPGRKGIAWFKLGVVPAVIYLAAFCVLTWPTMRFFASQFFCDREDGLTYVWNLWWVNKSLLQLHQLPFWTNYFYYPHGTSLLGNSTNVLDGVMAMPIRAMAGAVVAHNAVMVFSFVTAGVTAFWLAYDRTGALVASLMGGFAFSFTGHQFAHAGAHLDLISTEWLPLFVMAWLWLLEKPTKGPAILAATALALSLLCHYYFFLYCVLAAMVLLGVQIVRRRGVMWLVRPPFRGPVLMFVVLATLLAGWLPIAFFLADRTDHFTGTHPANLNSLDLLEPVIPGGHWRWAAVTKPFWQRMPGKDSRETSLQIGLGVLILAGYAWRRRSHLREPIGKWLALAGVFGVLALGPHLQIYGYETWIGLPYAWAEKLFPPLQRSGMPMRMVLFVSLAGAVLCAHALAAMWRRGRVGRMAAIGLTVLMVFELTPRPLPLTSPRVPGYIEVVRDQPGGAVLDTVNSYGPLLYYQTVYDKPMAYGSISRTPASVVAFAAKVEDLARRGEFETLAREEGYAYLITRQMVDRPGAVLLVEEDGVRVYDIRGLGSFKSGPGQVR